MKKFLALALAVMTALSLTACGGTTSDEVKAPSSVLADDGNEAEELTENGGNSEIEPAAENSNNNEADMPEEPEISIDETVLVDEAGVKITAKELDVDGIFGAELKLLIENESGQNLTFQCRNASVNGYMVETMMSVDIANGKKANDTLTFMSSDLETCGITAIADMDFAFHIFSMEDWETYLDTAQIQLKTPIADTYEDVCCKG